MRGGQDGEGHFENLAVGQGQYRVHRLVLAVGSCLLRCDQRQMREGSRHQADHSSSSDGGGSGTR